MEKRKNIDLTKENIGKSLIKLSIPLTLTALSKSPILWLI